MEQCARCGEPYEDVLPFCLKCEGYEAISYVTVGNYVSATYKKKDPPTMWRKPWTYPRHTDEPLWKGAATIAMARKVYGIKTQEEFREPSLFD